MASLVRLDELEEQQDKQENHEANNAKDLIDPDHCPPMPTIISRNNSLTTVCSSFHLSSSLHEAHTKRDTKTLGIMHHHQQLEENGKHDLDNELSRQNNCKLALA